MVDLLISLRAEVINGRMKTMTIVEPFDVEEKVSLSLISGEIVRVKTFPPAGRFVLAESADSTHEWGSPEKVGTKISQDRV